MTEFTIRAKCSVKTVIFGAIICMFLVILIQNLLIVRNLASDDELDLLEHDSMYREIHLSNNEHLKMCLNKWNLKNQRFLDRREARRNRDKNHPRPDTPSWQFEMYQPEMTVEMETRVGNIEDGGKFIVNPWEMYTKEQCLVYSVGSYGEYSFEEDLARVTNYSCEIHTFDPTLGNDAFHEKKAADGGFIFHPWGFAMEKSPDGIYDNLHGFMKRLGHEGRTLNILKVDCEGCEFEFFPKVFQDIREGKIDVGTINVELHPLDGGISRLRRFFADADDSDMRLFHRDPNVIGCDGWRCGEYSWISGKEAFRSHVLYLCPQFYSSWNSLWNEVQKVH